jgi:hypothetical protein
MAGPKFILLSINQAFVALLQGVGVVPFTQWLTGYPPQHRMAGPKIRYYQALAALLQGVGVIPLTQRLALHSIEWKALKIIPINTVPCRTSPTGLPTCNRQRHSVQTKH